MSAHRPKCVRSATPLSLADGSTRGSPITAVQRPGLPPTFIINGDNDHTYEPTQSYRLKAALDAAHVPNQEDIVVGGGHGNFTPAENQKGTILMLQFLRANGVLK